MSEHIVRELRKAADYLNRGETVSPLFLEDAADEIKSLQAMVKGLQGEVAFWLSEGQQERPEVIELQTLTKLASLNETQTVRIRELCDMFRLEQEDQPVLLAKVKSLQAAVDDKNIQLGQLAEECSGWIQSHQALQAVVDQLPGWISRLNKANDNSGGIVSWRRQICLITIEMAGAAKAESEECNE